MAHGVQIQARTSRAWVGAGARDSVQAKAKVRFQFSVTFMVRVQGNIYGQG